MNAELAIRLTWSKIMAFLILACSMILDMVVEKSANTFFMAAPIAAGLIAGKQFFDAKETINQRENEKTVYHLDNTK
jgi:Na+-transporting NADH:ubiquinone oxidoreductase subunit NqrB